MMEDVKVLKIRSTVERTNPQLIREICVDSDIDLDELSRILAIAYGLNSFSGSWKTEYEISLGQKTKVCAKLNEENSLIFKINPTKTMSMRDGRIFVDFVALEEIDEAAETVCPEVTYLNGYNLSAYADSIESLNRAYATMGRGGYVELGGRYRAAAELRADISRINAALNNKKGSTALELNPVFFYPTKSRLSEKPVNYLKMIAYNLDIDENQKKSGLIEAIERVYGSRRFLLKIMQGFTYEQYLVFRDHFTGKYTVSIDEAFRRWENLFRTDIIMRDSLVQMIKISDTFARNYQSWLDEGQDEKFFSMLKIASAVSVSCCLYGYSTRTTAEFLYKSRFAADFSEEMWREYLANLETGIEYGYCKTDEGLVYDAGFILEIDAKVLCSMGESLKYNFYMPTNEEFDEIAKNGLCFTKEEMKKLEEILERDILSITRQQADQIRRMAYLLTVGADEDDVIEEIETVIWYDLTKGARSSLKKQLKVISDRLPKAILKGHSTKSLNQK